jgi:hypothetical protein
VGSSKTAAERREHCCGHNHKEQSRIGRGMIIVFSESMSGASSFSII